MYDEGVDPQEYARVFEHETSHFWYRGLHALALAEMRRALATCTATKPRVLDAGCGTGGVLTALTAMGCEAVGIDASSIALDHARLRGAKNLVRASVDRIPLADESVDAVISLDVLYHRAVENDASALSEMARVVKPGGSVLLNLPAHPFLASAHDKTIHGARRYTKRRIREMAKIARLEVTRLGYWNSTLFPVLAAWRLLNRNSPASSDVSSPPPVVNSLLATLLRVEAFLFPHVPLPPGLSLFAVLKRPG